MGLDGVSEGVHRRGRQAAEGMDGTLKAEWTRTAA